MSCFCVCQHKNKVKAESTGWRATFYYPGGGTYCGFWRNSQNHHYGVKEDKNGLIYDGQWKDGKRHGHGTMRKCMANGRMERIYIGEWVEDKKCGEGKRFYDDGIYYGWWKDNRRHGLGMKWYNDRRFYMGEWEADVYHGIGILFYPNNNRYEGYFARGMKNGEGTFFHVHTGQVQKGMWQDDVCKASIMQDHDRNQGDQPTPYPLPRVSHRSILDPIPPLHYFHRSFHAFTTYIYYVTVLAASFKPNVNSKS